jgi:hypothetical protein
MRFHRSCDRPGVLHLPPKASRCHGAGHQAVHQGTHEGSPQRDSLAAGGDEGQLCHPGGLPQHAHLRARDHDPEAGGVGHGVGDRHGEHRQGPHLLEVRGGLILVDNQARAHQVQHLLHTQREDFGHLVPRRPHGWVGIHALVAWTCCRRPEWAPRRHTSPGLWVWECLHPYP